MKNDLSDRTKKFALRIIKLIKSLPNDVVSQTIGRQLIRSATSVAANYRAACRARSKAEFIAKLGIVVEEADESVFWIEMLIESEVISSEKVKDLKNETNEILSIMITSIKSAKKNSSKS